MWDIEKPKEQTEINITNDEATKPSTGTSIPVDPYPYCTTARKPRFTICVGIIIALMGFTYQKICLWLVDTFLIRMMQQIASSANYE